MTKPTRNLALLLRQREQRPKAHSTTDIILQKIAEEKAALATMKETYCKLPSSARSTFLMSFSPDSTKVASTHGDHKIYVCDVKTGKLLHKLEGHPRTPWCLAFHPTSNDILASGCLGGEVRIWHLHGGSEKWRAYHNTVITSLAFHPLDKVLVIATHNEIHFWDWSLPGPFACTSTKCIHEKVRFVKFDRLGNTLITGISIMPESMRTSMSNPPGAASTLHSSSLLDAHVPLPVPTVTSSTSNINHTRRAFLAERLQVATNLSHRRSLVQRLLNMYQNNEASSEGNSSQAASPPSSSNQYEEMTHNMEIANNIPDPDSYPNRDLVIELPSGDADSAASRQYVIPSVSLNEDTSLDAQRALLDSHEDFLVRAFWRTFNRLRTIYASLERRMLQLQQNTEQLSHIAELHLNNSVSGDREMSSLGGPLPGSVFAGVFALRSEGEGSEPGERPPHLLMSILTRLRNHLHQSHREPTVEEQLQRLQFRGAEILERLNNISGYRQRLQTLRDQIFEERTRRRSVSASIRRLDLAHCLWLVEMSLQLTQQMQRILQANYRLTQLHINPPLGRGAATASLPNSSTTLPRSSIGTPRDSHNTQSTTNTTAPSYSLSSANRGANTTTTPSTSTATRSIPNSDSSPEELDNAWDRLRHTVRQELANFSQRFNSDSLGPDLSRDPSPVSLLPDTGPAPSSAWNPMFASEHPAARGIMGFPRSMGEDSYEPEEDDDDEEEEEEVIRDQPQRVGPNLTPPETPRRPSSSTATQRLLESFNSNPANFIPEIFIVPSGADGEGPNILPMNERPRSPPLSAILSGAYDPLLSVMFQGDSSLPFPRFASEGSNVYHRIQAWDFSKCQIPNISKSSNIVVRKCKIHNDASVDISKNGELLVALLPSSAAVHSDSVFAVFSLRKENLGQMLHMSSFECNAISVSFSPLSQYIVIGLATPRIFLSMSEKQAVAQIFHLRCNNGLYSSSHVRSLTQEGMPGSYHMSSSLNSVQWLPQPGQGLIYGTNRGCLCICKPIAPMTGKITKIMKIHRSYSSTTFGMGIHDRNFGAFVPQRVFSAGTQTSDPEMQTIGTQTFSAGSSRDRDRER